jgi:hypothetical protein
MPKGNPAGYLPKKKKKGLKDNAAAYIPRSKQEKGKYKPDPHPSALADKVKKAATIFKGAKNAKGVVAAPPGKGGLSLREAVRGRKADQDTTAGKRKLTYEEALARRSTDSSRARVAARYGKTYTPGESRNTVQNAEPVKSGGATATINHPSKGKRKKNRRFDSRG